MISGIVKFKSGTGYGFIAVDNMADVFFHGRDLRDAEFDTIRVGDPVTIDRIDDTRRGTTARDVRLA
jgi:cold shock CspA family protein